MLTCSLAAACVAWHLKASPADVTTELSLLLLLLLLLLLQTGKFIPEKSNIWRDCCDGMYDWVKEHIMEVCPADICSIEHEHHPGLLSPVSATLVCLSHCWLQSFWTG
jgi:hypothetical protein